jgi:hypothetical protein
MKRILTVKTETVTNFHSKQFDYNVAICPEGIPWKKRATEDSYTVTTEHIFECSEEDVESEVRVLLYNHHQTKDLGVWSGLRGLSDSKIRVCGDNCEGYSLLYHSGGHSLSCHLSRNFYHPSKIILRRYENMNMFSVEAFLKDLSNCLGVRQERETSIGYYL